MVGLVFLLSCILVYVYDHFLIQIFYLEKFFIQQYIKVCDKNIMFFIFIKKKTNQIHRNGIRTLFWLLFNHSGIYIDTIGHTSLCFTVNINDSQFYLTELNRNFLFFQKKNLIFDVLRLQTITIFLLIVFITLIMVESFYYCTLDLYGATLLPFMMSGMFWRLFFFFV